MVRLHPYSACIRSALAAADGGSTGGTGGDDGLRLGERRLLEYVALGDFQTAVAFLLASSPSRDAR